MAQQATESARTIARQTNPAGAAEAVAAADGSQFPLDLTPILKPYRARARLLIRVERLPRHARLSRGRNNGDGSWSLAPDEVEGLMCLLPADVRGPHTLALRIIDVEAGTTLDVVELPIIAPQELDVEQSEASSQDNDGDALARKGDVDESRFSSLTASLLVRKRSTPAAASSAGGSGRKRAANATPDFLARKGEAAPSNPLPSAAASSTSEQNDEVSQLRAQCMALQTKLAVCETDLASAQAAAVKARDIWRSEADEMLTKAEAAWKSQSARQLASVEARWQEEYRKGLADARTEASRQVAASEARWEEQFKRNLTEARAASQAARDQSDHAATGLRDECAVLRATIASRELELQELRAASERERTQAQRELRDVLVKAEAAWKADTTRQFADAEARWRAQSEKTLGQAQAQITALRDQSDHALAKLREESAALRATVATRELELEQLRSDTKQQRERAQAELRDALAQAESAWRAEAVRQVAEAESQLQRSVTEAKAQAKLVAEQADELRLLKSEHAALKGAVANSETALAQVRSASQEERERWRREFEKALREGESAWKASSDRQLAAAEARWQEQSAAAVSAARIQAATARGQADGELVRVQEECAGLRSALAKSEAALERARADSEQWATRSRSQLERKAASTAETQRQLAAAQERCKGLVEECTQASAAREKLERECSALQETLAKSEAALAQARASAEQLATRSQSELQGKATSAANTQRQLAAVEARCKTLSEERAEAAAARDKFERECTALREALAKSDSQLEDARRSAKEAQERSRQELKEAIGKAAAAAKDDAARQLAATEARWKEERQQAIARIQAQADAARGDGSGETVRLRQEFETAQQLLSDKDAELERVRAEAESMRNEIDRHAKDAVVLAEKAWKANEANRLAAAEAAWKKRSSRELAEATTRFETAERALAQLRIRNSARDASDNAEIARLRDELAALQSSVAETSNNPWTGAPAEETRIVLRTNKDWDNLAQARNAKSRKSATAGMLVAGLLAVAALTLYAGVKVLGPQLSIPDLSAYVATSGPQPAAPKAAPAPDKTPKAILTHGANLREGPNTTTAVISSLPKGAEVALGEQRGKWTQVRLADGHQGWVFTEFLQPQTQDASAGAAAAKGK